MKFYAVLNDLLAEDAASKKLYASLPTALQTMLREQRQDICTREELAQVAEELKNSQH